MTRRLSVWEKRPLALVGGTGSWATLRFPPVLAGRGSSTGRLTSRLWGLNPATRLLIFEPAVLIWKRQYRARRLKSGTKKIRGKSPIKKFGARPANNSRLVFITQLSSGRPTSLSWAGG